MSIPFSLDVSTILVIAALAAWCVFFMIVLVNGLSVQPLREVPLLVPKEQLPSLTVITAACNEADTIEEALRSLLSTEYPHIEFLIVNDRSSDETGSIIDRIAATDDRVKPIHINKLPEGWLGKVHALHIASKKASGDFLLFTDADIHFTPNALSLALGYVEHHHVDHFVVLPETRPPSRSSALQQWLVSIAISGFISLFLFGLRLYSLRNPKSPAFVGVGAFNLVRKSAFLKTPGFEWLKMEVLDDIGLGMMMKRSGARCDAANGFGLIHLEWYATLGAAAKGFEKNFFAGFGRYSKHTILWRTSQIAAMVYSPYFAAFWAWFVKGEISLAYAIFCVHFILPIVTAFILQKRLLFHPFFFGALPVSFFLVIGMIVRSTWQTLRKGGILWRGTFYPLETLRREQRVKM